MGEAPDLAVAARGALEIQVRAGVREPAARRDPEMLEQRLAREVRRPAAGLVHADVHVGLAEIRRQELRVAIGEVEQGNVAPAARKIVDSARALRAARVARERHPARGRRREHLEELSPRHDRARER
jgi:hypothetical protein